MNCCDDYGKCTGAHGCPARAECHVPCSTPPAQQRYPFAPGVIDQGEPGSRPELVAAVVLALALLGVLALLGALAAVLGLIFGCIEVGGLP